MRIQEPEDRRRAAQLRMIRFDLAFRAALVAAMWLVLRLLGAELDPFVTVAVLAAIFGQDVARAGWDWLSGRSE